MKYLTTILLALIIMSGMASAATISLAGTDLPSTEGSTLKIEILSTDPFPAKPGQTVEIDVRVTNTGNRKAPLVLLEIKDEFPFRAIDDQINFGELPPGISGTKKITASISKDSITGDVTLPIRASPDGGSTWFEPKPTISIRESNSILAVVSAKTIPEYIIPGHDGILQIRLRNDGGSTLSSVEILLGENDVPIVPAEGSNIRYLSSLRPDQTVLIEFPISAKSDAVAGNYAPELHITYNDFTSSTTKTYVIGLKIFEEPNYLLNIESRDVYTNNDLGPIVMSLANTGTSDLKFASITILPGEGYEVIDGDSTYLGDLESDDFQTAEFNIKLNTKAEEIKLKVQVSFKDSFNRQVTEVTEVKLRVFDQTNAILLGLKESPNFGVIVFNIMIGSVLIIFWVSMVADWKKNKNLTKDKRLAWIAILILANLLGAVLYYFIGRKARK